MGLQQNLTSSDGTEHPSAYWRVVQTNLCQSERTGRISIYGYKDKTASDEKKTPVAERHYPIDTGDYDSYFTPEKLNAEGRDIVERAYTLIKERKELLRDGFTQEGDVFKDPRGEEVTESEAKKSFFESATDV